MSNVPLMNRVRVQSKVRNLIQDVVCCSIHQVFGSLELEQCKINHVAFIGNKDFFFFFFFYFFSGLNLDDNVHHGDLACNCSAAPEH